ncbi:MAG: protein-tyrosine-phosphatase [Saprospiraceae bacterium]|nr:protein-tyrosine-phosphatase [Saprospiraceae bacterium]
MLPALKKSIDKIRSKRIPEDRKAILQPLIDYIQHKIEANQEINLHFICTHNSRRSQFSQIWAKTAADYFRIPANCFSGGVEVTTFNETAVESIKRSGFKITAEGNTNPVYSILNSADNKPIRAFSKLFDDPINKAEKFAAIMTCSHADEDCPFIPGTEKRIAVNYEDPKAFDGTPQESAKYDERSLQIASEMFYVFSNIKTK